MEAEIKKKVPRPIGQAELDEFHLINKVAATSIKTLSRTDFQTNLTFTGYIYNVQLQRYLTVDSTPKWVYADSVNVSGALRFTINRKGDGRVFILTQIGNTVWYLNYRNSTGAVKVYDSYDNLTLTWLGTDTFKIYSDDQEQYMGLKDRDSSDNEMYYHATVYKDVFQYHYLDRSALNSKDLEILDRHNELFAKAHPKTLRQGSATKSDDEQ